MVDILTVPTVMTILLIIGISGIVIELLIPNFVTGLIGIAAFALYFYAHYATGNAEMIHIALFIIGIILLLVEALLPSFGIIGIAGIISVISGVVMAANNTENAMISLGIAMLISIIIVAVVAWYFKHKGIWNKFVLKEQTSTETGYVSQPSQEHLVGKIGITVTPLRPAGIAMIDDERIDVVSGGEFIGADVSIKVILVEGTRVVVRQIEKEGSL